MFDFTNPTGSDPGKGNASRSIKRWVEEAAALSDEGVVHVAELRCHEPGCPDFETVITLMLPPPRGNRTVKIFKPIAEVSQEEVGAAVATALSQGDGTTPCDHDHD